MTGLRIVFMGTPGFAATILQALLGSAHEVVCVYSQPPRPSGRGHKLQKSPVHALAEARGIPVYTPESLKSAEAQAEFVAHGVDVAVVAAYGLILPKSILDAPKYGCLNVHASLLPRWRGASPIQRAIWAGDEKSGVTIMQMDEGLDTGPMILKGETAITPETTATMLHDELAAIGGRLIVQALDRLAAQGRLESEAQDASPATYASMLGKDDGRVDWSASADSVARQVRALTPWPGVWSESKGRRYKIVAADAAQETALAEGQTPGTVLDREGCVACGGGGVLRIRTIQPAGAKAMDFASAVNGGYIAPGDVLKNA